MNGLWKVLVFLVLGFCLSERLAANQPVDVLAPETVRQRGDLDQLVLEGNKTFSSSAIKATLTWDFDVLMAGHPAAPWTTFVGVIQRKIETGYRASGFAEVRVDVRPNALQGKLLVHIEEGPRYLAGGVSVRGAHTLSAKLLTERLTKPYWSKEALESGKTDAHSKMEDPVWEVGKPAYFPNASAKAAADILPGSGAHFAEGSASPSSAWRLPQTPISAYGASNIGGPTYSTIANPHALSEKADSLDTANFSTTPLYTPHLNDNLAYSARANRGVSGENAGPLYTADINVGPLYTPGFNDRLSYGSFAAPSHGDGSAKSYGNSPSVPYHGATTNPYSQSPLEPPIPSSNRYTLGGNDNGSGLSGSAPRLSRLESQVADALADLGYFFPRFEVDVVPNARQRTAELAITVFDDGPRAMIGEIDTSGNKINSREEIVNYLKVHPGDPYNRKNLFEMKRRLLDSGRFVDVDIKPLATSYSPRLLWIDVKELEKVPPLSKPLLPEEEILLKCGKWFGDIDRWQGDMVIQTEGSLGTLTIVVSPHRGILATASLKSLKRSGPRPDYAFVVTQDEIGFFSVPRGRKVVAAHLQSKSKLNANLEMGLIEEKEDQGKTADEAQGNEPPAKTCQKSNLKFGLGMQSIDAGETAPPFALNMKVLPASFLINAHRANTTYVLRDGLLSALNEDFSFVINASSGRLLQFKRCSASDEPSDKADGKKATDRKVTKVELVISRVSFESGALDRRLKVVYEMAKRYPNDYDPRAPVTSFCGLMSDEEPAWKLFMSQANNETTQYELRSVRTLMNRHVIAGVGDLFDRLADESPDEFPEDEGCTENECSFATFAQAIQIVFHYAMVGSNATFPRYSWPWTLVRESSLTVIGKGQYTDRELQRISESNSCGPLGFLAASTLLQCTNSPASRLFAARGLEKLPLADFRKDYQIFLDEHWVAGRTVQRLAIAFRTMSDQEVQQLAKFYAVKETKYFQIAVRTLRTNRKRPIKEALSDFLDACWNAGLQQQVEAALDAASRGQDSPANVL